MSPFIRCQAAGTEFDDGGRVQRQLARDVLVIFQAMMMRSRET